MMAGFEYRIWHPLLARLPRAWAYKFATLGGYGDARSMRDEQAAIIEGLKEVFPLTDATTLRHYAASLPRMQAREKQDVYRLPRIDAANIDTCIRMDGLNHYQEARADDRPVILYSAHFSRLIMPAIALALKGGPIHSLVTDIEGVEIPEVERDYLRFKLDNMARLLGGDVIARGRDTRALFKVLSGGGSLVIIVDAPAAEGDRPIAVPFLGGIGRFSPGILKLARRYNARLLPYFAVEREGRLRGEVHAPVGIAGLDDPAAMLAIMAPVESMIRRHPEQWWMWPHLHAIWSPRPIAAENDSSVEAEN